MKTSVFTYGTLQFPEVMAAVTGQQFSSCPALIKDYARFQLKQRIYPGLRHQPGAVTQGTLYIQVGMQAVRLLDGFEGDEYRRQTLPVTILDGQIVKAEVYVIPPEHYRLLTADPWDQDQFKKQYLISYSKQCTRYYHEVRHGRDR